MVRSFQAAWLLAVLAALGAVRAEGVEPVNPLRSAGSLSTQLGTVHKPATPDIAATTYLADEASEPLPEAVLTPPPQTGIWPEAEPEPYCEPGVQKYFRRARTPHRDPNDPQRHFGIGEPLLTSSWRNRPLYVSLFAGGLIGDELQEGLISQGGGFFAGGRFGGDFDHYWGLETRLAFSDLNTNFAGGGFGQSRDSFFDASLLYYPWGDSRWRPYLTIGLGVANYRYTNQAGTKISGGALEMPWGGGVKYLLLPNVALRFDLIDNFSFDGGGKVDNMHNVSFTGGIEFRFGGRPTHYGSW